MYRLGYRRDRRYDTFPHNTAALENQITADNADRIQAPVIVEVANGPVTSDADVTLSSSGSQSKAQ